jgi:hypothetical protein
LYSFHFYIKANDNFNNANKAQNIEGKFTQEGGGLDTFNQRVETLGEM